MKLNKILEVYTDDLSVGFLYEMEKTKSYDPEYMKNEDWCFTSTLESSNHNINEFGCTGEWNKLSMLLFVNDHEDKIKKIITHLEYTNKIKLDIDEIIDILI